MAGLCFCFAFLREKWKGRKEKGEKEKGEKGEGRREKRRKGVGCEV